jgi:hypothetical protein
MYLGMTQLMTTPETWYCPDRHYCGARYRRAERAKDAYYAGGKKIEEKGYI